MSKTPYTHEQYIYKLRKKLAKKKLKKYEIVKKSQHIISLKNFLTCPSLSFLEHSDADC